MNKPLTKVVSWKGILLSFFLMGSIPSHSLKAENIVLGSYVQDATITVQKKITLRELFNLIEKETSFDFFFSSNLKGLDKSVNLNLSNKSVDKVLSTAFSNTNLEYTISGKDIMIREASSTQQQVDPVSGVVLDETGTTLPGVNVMVKGTTIGSSTDFDGKFEIEASKGETLVFSFMGYEDYFLKVNDDRNYTISMIPAFNVLDEIIVSGVASGTSKKKMSVSVAKINSDAINQVPQSSVSSSLQGKVAGVTVTSSNGSPGSGSGIQLRGATSLSGGSNPMILLDGVIMQGSLADINVDDVETMEVVKGAAASALYGSRAANGVVVITTRRGSSLKEGQTTVTFRNEVGVQQVAKYLDLAKSHVYDLDPTWLDVDTYTKFKYVNYPADYVGGWEPAITGSRRKKEDGYMDMPYRVNNDLQSSMFTNGLSYTNYIGVGHRVNHTNLFISFENNADQGVVVETGGYKRQSFRVNIDHAISENVKISASNNYIITSNDKIPGGTSAFFNVLMMEPDVDLFAKNENGQDYLYYPNHWSTQINNPLYDLAVKDANSTKTRFLGSYDLKWRFTDWMSFKGSYAVESQDYTNVLYTPKGSYVGMKFVDGEADGLVESEGSYSKKTSKIFNQNFRATLNFNHSWGELDFNGKLSYLLEDNHFEYVVAEGSRMQLPNLPSLGYIKQEDSRAYDRLEDIKAENYFAIVSLVYKDRYIFDALYRKDGSSLFGENERWHDYFRVSGAYRISEDIKISGIEEMKVRAAYGTAGQRPGFDYQYETFSINNGVFSKYTLGNKDLKPAQSAELEVGFDISFLERFRAELTYSHTNSTDQFIKAPLMSAFGGYSYQWQNAAEMQTNTFEAMFNANIIKTNDWSWDLTLTFDKTRSEITKLDVAEYQTGPRSAFKIREGEVFGGMYGVDFVRNLDQMKEQLPSGGNIDDYIVNSDGVVVEKAYVGTTNERAIPLLEDDGSEKEVKIGDMNPDFRMGLNTTVSYKGLSLYMLWQWKQGGDMYNGTAQYLVRDNRHAMMDQIHTKPENKKTVDYYQSLYDAQAINGFWVEDTSYLRLREASLYYNLNKESLGNVGNYIQNIRMGIIARNLLTFTAYSGYDPEAGYSVNGGPTYAFDNYGYPNFKNYSFSIELKF